jgi:hypothetical protein
MILSKNLYRSLIAFVCLVNIAYATETLVIKNAWSPEAPPVARVMAGYMKIINNSDHDLQIVSAKSVLFNKVEIHLMDMKGGMMRMIKQDKLPVKAHGQVELKPGVLHMMLIGPKKPIKSGSVIPVTLILNNHEKVSVELKVKSDTQ